MPPPSRSRRRIIPSSDEEDEIVSDDDDDGDSDYIQKASRNVKAKRQQNSKIYASQIDSQNSPISSVSQSQEPLNENELKRLSFLCANYFLLANCKKIPIKRSDVGKIIPKEYSRKCSIILDSTSSVLKDVFGYNVVELDKKGQLILVNNLDLSSIFGESMPFPVQPRESAIILLRTHILIAILMRGGVVSESTLNEFIRCFEIDIESKNNYGALGNPQKLIYQDMVRQGYLDIMHHKDVDTPFKEIRWGSRAKLELNKKEIIQFVCKIYGENIKPEMWVEQWNDAQSEDSAPSTSTE